jgi:hypothetical protein
MKIPFVLVVTLAPCALLASERVARAADEQPIAVEYVAPPAPECPSTEAFRARLTVEVQREAESEAERDPRTRTEWNFAVRIRRDAHGYMARLTSPSRAQTIHAPTCDETASVLARLIAEVEPEPGPRRGSAGAGTSDAVSPETSSHPADETEAPSPPADKGVLPSAARDTRKEWRLGFRAQAWTHGAGYTDASSYGGMGVASLELPWGLFHRTMFELGAGAMESQAASEHLTYYVLDTQVCPAVLPFGTTGISALGCFRLAGACFSATDIYGNERGGALWFGAGARLRWQSEGPVFVELHLNGVYGTVSGPEVNNPAWADVGGMLGVRL